LVEVQEMDYDEVKAKLVDKHEPVLEMAYGAAQVMALVEWMLVLASPVIASSTLAMSPWAYPSHP